MDADVENLSAKEQAQISQVLAELQNLPAAALSPQLESRLQSLSYTQPTPSNPLKRFLALLAAGFAATGAALTWQFSGLEIRVAQKEPAAVALSKAPSTTEAGPIAPPFGQQRVPTHQQSKAWRSGNGDDQAGESNQSACGGRLATIAHGTDLPALGNNTLWPPGLHDFSTRRRWEGENWCTKGTEWIRTPLSDQH